MRIKIALAALVLVTASVLQRPASAETRAHQANLRVLVVDQTHAVLPHATVTVYTLDGAPSVTVTADEKGYVVIPAVATGMTQIVATFPGFAPAFDKATLKVGENARTVVLHLAQLDETVTVKATPEPNGKRS